MPEGYDGGRWERRGVALQGPLERRVESAPLLTNLPPAFGNHVFRIVLEHDDVAVGNAVRRQSPAADLDRLSRRRAGLGRITAPCSEDRYGKAGPSQRCLSHEASGTTVSGRAWLGAMAGGCATGNEL